MFDSIADNWQLILAIVVVIAARAIGRQLWYKSGYRKGFQDGLKHKSGEEKND